MKGEVRIESRRIELIDKQNDVCVVPLVIYQRTSPIPNDVVAVFKRLQIDADTYFNSITHLKLTPTTDDIIISSPSLIGRSNNQITIATRV